MTKAAGKIDYDLVVIGGGAAGIFAAINAANQGAKVLVLEKSDKLLAKVSISGGGRCNVTHACFDVAELLKKYPRGSDSLKSVFKQFAPTNSIAWFQDRGVALHTEADGRMFPTTNDSQTIIDCFLLEAKLKKVEIRRSVQVKSILNGPYRFEIIANESCITCHKVLIATGGNSQGIIRNYLKNTGHSLVEEVPSLFTFNIPQNPILKLMGVSVAEAKVKILGSKYTEQGPLLVTHWGLSGPAILRLSAYAARDIHAWKNNFKIEINWLNTVTDEQFKSWFQRFRSLNGKKKVVSKNPFDLPNRLWDYLLSAISISEKLNWADVNKMQLSQLMQVLLHNEYQIQGKTTFKEEFVTAGGISLDDVDLKTMQSRKVNGLHFAGEVLNVDGITGGFNFQFAWSSGWIVSQQVLETKSAQPRG